MHAEGNKVLPPDEDDVAHVFNPLRQMCQANNVRNSYLTSNCFIKNSNKYFVMDI